MRYYIKIKNEIPVEHPIAENNFKQAFPHVDLNNLPSEFLEFQKTPIPILETYQTIVSTEYVKIGSIVKEQHIIRDMTQEEKLHMQNLAKEYWKKHGFDSWIFDENICQYKPPVIYPSDGKLYKWDESVRNWKEIIIE